MMENSCHHCRGTFFIGEQHSHNVFTKCCFHGKVTLPPIATTFSKHCCLVQCRNATVKAFLENIRQYNAAMAMVSWNATVNQLPGRGPRVVTIHGFLSQFMDSCHNLTSATDAADGEHPQYSQLYILDTNQALQERINDPRNVNLQPEVLQLLQDELMAVNPLKGSFKI